MTPRRYLTPLAGGILLTASWLGPAAAQNPFDFLFGRSSNPPPPPAAAPAKNPAASPATPANTVLPPKRPGSRPEQAQAAPAAPAQGASKPATSAPVVTATAPAAATASTATAGPLTDKQIVERANTYFNGITSLVGDFVQVGGDGRRLTGKLYLQRPGKIRFEYDAPATLEVIADGSSVAVRDKKLATQDLYSIGQTPLKFLLRDRIDLGRDLKITEVASENDGVRVSIEDKSTLGGTSKITLYFDQDVANLTRWRIMDPQGFQTSVALANLERNPRIEQQLFNIDYQRILGDSK
jgi:outer membrane lipoprotein-sorting protein